ncbi:MAG: hypothetical protein WAM67_01505, partial [Candidatus Acidiferrales bacterium]
MSVDLFQARGEYITWSQNKHQALFSPVRRANYECSVKVFNSSVEIRVEKHPATIEIDCRNRALLLFAQV